MDRVLVPIASPTRSRMMLPGKARGYEAAPIRNSSFSTASLLVKVRGSVI
jgi:hypothetical protein